MDRTTHQIGEVAEAVGLSLRTIRYDGEVGLAPPSARTSGGFRLYTGADIERLRFIKRMKPLDFSLDEMRQVIAAAEELAAGPAPAERAVLEGRLAMFTALAEERCTRLREQLDAGEQVVAALRGLLATST